MRPALVVLCLSFGVAIGEEPPRITEIEIRTGNVFTPSEAEKAFFPYRLANAIHVVSRKSLIEKYLLFRVGDTIDPEQLAQTERNLRATGLFWYVVIGAEGSKVIVETQDTWTLLIRGGISKKGDVLTYQAGVEEKNLLGTGRQLNLLYDKGSERTSRSISVGDPAFVWPYTSLGLLYSDLSDGKVYEARLSRPFYALDTPWMAGFFYHHAWFEQKMYAGGEEAANWRERLRSARAEGGLLLGVTGSSAVRLIGSVEWSDVVLQQGPFGPPPPEEDSARRFFYFGAGLEHEGRSWITPRDVEKIGRVEDVNLAAGGRAELSLSPPIAGATAASRIVASGTAGTTIPFGFALGSLNVDTRYANGFENSLLAGDARAIVQTAGLTFVARLGSLVGWRLDPEVQIPLDGDSGVRGYRLHAVEGTGRAVGNLEVRKVFFYDVLSLVSFGAAAFVDGGVSWGAPDGFWRLGDAGVGLRFGLTRAADNSLLRLDIARAFHPDPLGRTGWLVSFSSSQAF